MDDTTLTSAALRSAAPVAADGRGPTILERAAGAIVMRRLQRLAHGRLALTLPDGQRHVFRGATDGPGATLQVHRWAFFPRLALGGDLGAGESYTDGEWDTPDLVSLARLFLANDGALGLGGSALLPGRVRDRLQHALRSNSQRGAKRNIRAHYDLGNDFYRLWLDETMTYSAAQPAGADEPLAAAQRRKYRRLAATAGIRPGMRVLEIGCGWGGFAEHVATELGARVTGITLSEAQAAWARRRIAAVGLEDRVEIQLVDYRDVRGRFDAIVSIEMLEAVGHRYLPRFFAACERLLAPGGRVALQTISFPDQAYDRYRRSTDWIRKHVFPGGHLPSLGALQQAMAQASHLVVRSLDDIAPGYAATLARWRHRFVAQADEIAALGFDARFMRTWEFYLATCEAAFAHRKLGCLQLGLARQGDGGR